MNSLTDSILASRYDALYNLTHPMPKEVYLQPGEEVRVIARPKRSGRPLISEEERRAQAARRHALSQARDAARQLSLGLRHLQGGDPDTKSSFRMMVIGMVELCDASQVHDRGTLLLGQPFGQPPQLRRPRTHAELLSA